MELDNQQQKALNYVKAGLNVFLTAPGGCGKSFTLTHIAREMRNKGKTVYVTATTGIAATTVGGRTLHSWAGIGIDMNKSTESLVRRVYKHPKASYRWLDADLLIIDEVSMLDYRFLRKLEEIARIVRCNNKVFGGIQILMVGDHAQLPPVQKDRKEPRYIFEDDIWNQIVDKNVLLTKVYRQNDKEFIEMLMRIRDGVVTDNDEKNIRNTEKNLLTNQWGIVPTSLFCTRKDVEFMNEQELKKLDGELFEYNAEDFYEDNENKKNYEKNWRYPKSLKLKVGAQVMLLTNNYFSEFLLVNGSRGIITGIEKDKVMIQFLNGQHVPIKIESEKVEGDRDKIKASRSQFPVMLAWCMTIHKSQSQTIEYVKMDLGKVFTYAQAYVALSRGVSLDKMIVKNFEKGCVRSNEKVMEFYRNIKEEQDNELTKKFKRKIKHEIDEKYTKMVKKRY